MSDQDFFFDEDEAPAEEPKKAPSETPKPKAQGRASGKHASAVQPAPTVTMTVAGLIGVVALLVGVIIGILIPIGASTPTSPASMSPPGATDSGEARPLSPEELESGDMPPGHPDIGEMLGGMETETPAPDAEPVPEAEPAPEDGS